MDIEPGTVVANRYRISRAIGRGGMGEVFAAENIRTGRPVAVKLLRADSKSKSSAVERFRREARAAGSINSDHVTQVLDVEDDAEHGIVIVFELLEGESLIDRLKRTGPIPFDELHPIIDEVWVGLADAHKVGIIHRDLKPSNVFLERRPDGHQRVKILDFGISKLPKEMGGETLTEMGQSLGTFSFMPPEQIGRAKTVDHRADIYATTTMIYQSLTGQLPYVARNILVMVEMKSKTNPRPLSEALGHPVDVSLEDFVATGLARNPADRFQNALDALERWRALKSLRVPESRRAVSMSDPNLRRLAQQLQAQQNQAPIPAAGRAPTGNYGPPRTSPGAYGPTSAGGASSARDARPPLSREQPYSRGQSGGFTPMSAAVPSGMSPPALVVPAGTLEPVRSGSGALPRLDEPTETTTDHSHDRSHIDLVHPKQSGGEGAASSVAGAGVAQRGQELRAAALPDLSGERKGPQGTRVLPPSVVQQAVSIAEARKASNAAAAAAAAQAQGQGPQSLAHSQQGPQAQHAQQQARPATDPRLGQQQGLPADRRQTTPTGQQPGHAGNAQPASQGQPGSQQGSGAHPHANAGYSSNASSAPPPPSSSLNNPASGVQPASHAPSSAHPASSGAHGQAPSSAPPSGGPSGSQGAPSADPRHLAQGSTPFPSGPQAPSQQGNFAQQQQQLGLPPLRQGGPVQLSTMRLPDEPSSIPASQDKTTVFRPKNRKPEKKQSVAVFVVGALAFAIVGFGIVFVVQWVVHRFAGH